MADLNISTDFVAQADVQTPAGTTGVWGDATGVENFAFRIALTKTGAALGALSATAVARSGDGNRYYAVFDAAALTSALSAYVGRYVYVILSRSGDLDGMWWRVRVTTNTPGA